MKAAAPVRDVGGFPAARLALAAAVWAGLYLLKGPFADGLTYRVLGLVPASRLADAVHFFLFDVVKIVLLLVGIIFVVTVVRSFFSVERTRALLGGRREGAGNVLAAGLGVVTPFCSCSAVPAFIGFVAAGVPLGVTLSFLIASPMVNEIALVMLFGMFGWGIAALYLVSGLALAVVAGMVLGRLRLERWVEPFVFETRLGGQALDPSRQLTWHERVQMGVEEVGSILGKIWPYLLVGIGLGAAIHGWVPQSFFLRYAGPGQPLAVPVAVVLGIPLYSNAAGILPLVEALHAKGLAMGTTLAFMMAVVALSLPEMIILRRVLKPRLIGLYVAVVGAGILATGFLFNAVL
ncbi:MAG: permease [Deinococcales bacterium]